MAEILYLHGNLDVMARLLAVELQPMRSAIRNRQIRLHAGRIAETMRREGAERWQAVLVEDAFAERVRTRLAEIDELARRTRSNRVAPQFAGDAA
jgi:hypothetical protein